MFPASAAACAALIVASALAPVAAAQEQPAPDAGAAPVDTETAARERFQAGLRLFEVQDYPAAIRELRAAYQLSPNPSVLYTLGQAHRMGGDCKSAIEAYRSFLRASPSDQHADLARRNIERCENELETSAPPPRPAPAPPAPPPAPLPAGPRWYGDGIGGALAIAGAVGLLSAGYLATVRNRHVELANGAPDVTTYLAERSAANDWSVASVATLSAGWALLAGAAVRYVVVAHTRKPAGTRIDMAGTRDGAQFVLQGEF